MPTETNRMPISLRVSYKEELQLSLSVPQQFKINKFGRHWIILYGFDSCFEYNICKKYFSYLNQGDLIKIKGNFFKINWKQKSSVKIQNFQSFLFEALNKIKSNPQDFYSVQNNQSYLRLFHKIQSIFKEQEQNQIQGMKIVSLFLNLQFKNQIIIKILQQIKLKNNSNIYFNIFFKQLILKQNRNLVVSMKKNIQFYQLEYFDDQIKNMFYKIAKSTVKIIQLKLQCLNGEMSKKHHLLQKQNFNDWILQNCILKTQINYPNSNKIYFHIIQLRNLGYLHTYEFRLSMSCVDINDISYYSMKNFKLRPSRSEFNTKSTRDFFNQNLSLLNQLNQKSFNQKENGLRKLALPTLTVQSMKYLDKLQSMKQLGSKIFVEIKNNININNQNLVDDQLNLDQIEETQYLLNQQI